MAILDILKKSFTNEKVNTLKKAGDIIKSVLESLNVDEKDVKIDVEEKQSLGWLVFLEDVYIYIYVFRHEDNDLYIKMVSPVMFLPEKDILPLYRKLLEYNLHLHDIGFAVESNVIMLLAQRKIEFTNINECKNIIKYILNINEKVVKPISKEFKAKRFELEDK